jgi:hypothetical protein
VRSNIPKIDFITSIEAGSLPYKKHFCPNTGCEFTDCFHIKPHRKHHSCIGVDGCPACKSIENVIKSRKKVQEFVEKQCVVCGENSIIAVSVSTCSPKCAKIYREKTIKKAYKSKKLLTKGEFLT